VDCTDPCSSVCLRDGACVCDYACECVRESVCALGCEGVY